MFYILILDKSLLIAPKFLGPKLQDKIKLKLIEAVQGTCSGENGFIVTVIDVVEYGEGYVKDMTGEVLFKVKYKAIVFRPRSQEVIDGVVVRMNDQGIFLNMGPMNAFISKNNMPADLSYNPSSSIYESTHDNAPIKVESNIRFRIKGMCIEANQVVYNIMYIEQYLECGWDYQR